MKKIKTREIFSSFSRQNDRVVEIVIKTNPPGKRYWNFEVMKKVIRLVTKIENMVLKLK